MFLLFLVKNHFLTFLSSFSLLINWSLPEPVSFKEKLIGKNSRDIHEEMDDWLSNEDDGDESEEEDEPNCPSIKLTKTKKVRLRKSWKQTNNQAPWKENWLYLTPKENQQAIKTQNYDGPSCSG